MTAVTATNRQTRHLTAVTNLAAARVQLAILQRLAAGPEISSDVIDRLEELDALHGTACDVYDIATGDR